MKRYRYVLIMFVVLSMFLFGGCAQPVESGPAAGRQAGDKQTFSADGATFSLAFIPGKKCYPDVFTSTIASVAYDYWIGETEVTYALWNTVYTWALDHGYYFANAGDIGSGNSGSVGQPVTNISWYDALVWCNAATEWYNWKKGTNYECVYTYCSIPCRNSLSSFQCENASVVSIAQGFRLPFWDEWGLAATYKADLNNDGDILDDGEYYPSNYASGATADFTHQAETLLVAICDATETAPVGSRIPTTLGLYDMSGNVEEWCFDTANGFRETRSSPYYCAYNNTYVGYGYCFAAASTLTYVGFRLARTNTMIMYIVEPL